MANEASVGELDQFMDSRGADGIVEMRESLGSTGFVSVWQLAQAHWVGPATLVDLKEKASPAQVSADVDGMLTLAAEGVYYMSESDQPFDVVRAPVAEGFTLSEADFKSIIAPVHQPHRRDRGTLEEAGVNMLPASHIVETIADFNAYLAEMEEWYAEDPDPNLLSEMEWYSDLANGYQGMFTVLSENLEQVTVFRVGGAASNGAVIGPVVDIYWVGIEAETGDLVGVHTVSIET